MMKEPVRRAPALIVVMLVFAMALGCLNLWALVTWLRPDPLADAPEAVGQVESVASSVGRYGSTRFATVSYDVVGADGATQRFERKVRYSGVHLVEGQPVRVRYLADDPVVADLSVNAARDGDAVLAVMVALVVDVMLLLVWGRAWFAGRRRGSDTLGRG